MNQFIAAEDHDGQCRNLLRIGKRVPSDHDRLTIGAKPTLVASIALLGRNRAARQNDGRYQQKGPESPNAIS
ncbi:hypothetical protein A3726_17655 [Erythrobacter sp. HI0037]|nr:hypothetical protein A3726_17655 [Erythrobacter sp. HI0037]